MRGVDTVLHRLEALPGAGRYAVTFRRPDGSEQTATMHYDGAMVQVAEASLPVGWKHDSEAFRATAVVVGAFDAARREGPAVPALRDIDGGWDVSLGNVVLSAAGVPQCTAHGDMAGAGESFTCAECGAAALLG